MVLPHFHITKTPATAKLQRSSDLSSPVIGLHSVGRLTSGRFCWVCLGTGEFLRPQGAIPPAFTPFGGVKGECRRGRRYFWPCQTRVGFGPATGTTLKTALCHIRALVGRMINYQRSSDALRSRSKRSPKGSNPTSRGVFAIDITYLCTNGPFKGHKRSPSAGRSISGSLNWLAEIDGPEANTKTDSKTSRS